jgi:hypothetical protein
MAAGSGQQSSRPGAKIASKIAPPPPPKETIAQIDNVSDAYYKTKTEVFNALIDTIDLSQLAQLDLESAREEIRDIVIDQDRVVVRRTCRMRHRGTAKVMDVDFCDWMQFDGGFVSHLSLMPETLALAELVA